MKKKRGRLTLHIALAFFVVLLGYSGYQLYQIYSDNKEIEVGYEEIRDEFISTLQQEIETDKTEDLSQVQQMEFKVDWTNLKKKNVDVIGWIYIPQTNINYPVMQGKSNEEYLYQNINHTYSRGGSIFLDTRNQANFEDDNSIIYGHNLSSGNQMFSNIRKFTRQDFFDSHSEIFLYLPDGYVNIYRIFSFRTVISNDNQIYGTVINSKKDYVKTSYNNSQVKGREIGASEISKILTLSTCTNQDKDTRYVLQAILVSTQKE